MCSSDKSSGLGHPAPLPHSDCNAEPVADIERGGNSSKSDGGAVFKRLHACLEQACGALSREGRNPASKCDYVVLDNLSAPQTNSYATPSFPNYALVEGNIILRQGQGGAI